MEVRRDEEQSERMRRCSRCMVKGDKMCYQHIVSYLFPVNKKHDSPDSAKIEEKSSQKLIPVKLNGDVVESKKFEEEKEKKGNHGDVKEIEKNDCTPGVCENSAEREEKSPLEITLTKLKEKLIRSKKKEEEENARKISVRGKKGRGEEREIGISRVKFRKIAEKFDDIARSNEGLGSVVEGKLRKCVQNEEEGEDEDEGDALFGDDSQPEEDEKEIEKCTPGVCENGAKEIKPKIDKRIKIDSSVCHQCHRGDKGRVIRCSKCKSKRFCIPCVTTWYPQMTEEQIALACPICRGNCNCKACLRMEGPSKNQVHDGYNIKQEVKIDHSKKLLRAILPFLKQFNQEQLTEKEIEAKIQGVLISEVEIHNAIGRENERVFCNNCRNSIVDFHRTCPECMYDLCLTCCREVRAGQLQGCKEAVMEYVDRDLKYMHAKSSRGRLKKPSRGYNAPAKLEESARCKRAHAQSERIARGKDASAQSKKISRGFSPEFHFDDQNKAKSEWKAGKNGAIICPPRIYEGCGGAFLELKSILSDGWVSELMKKAEQTVAKWEQENSAHAPEECSCSALEAGDGSILRKCAFREGSDKYLFCPDARDIQHGVLKHFQWHWTLGEPVIVRSALETNPGLSWEPMVMWRAFREVGNRVLKVKAIDCSDWSEVDLNAHQFFKDYSRLESAKGPILKLKDWPPVGKFEQRLPRHSAEVIRALPFKDYTHPRDGVLNLAAKWPSRTLKPDLGPKAYIAYGRAQELGCGDSVTKLHSHMSDVVNILTHTTKGTLHLGRGACPSEILKGAEDKSEGALWDIFRREDVLKLQEYLKGHFNEFKHNHCFPVNQVVHPIHDQTFYLTEEHKRKLKEEYGIEPWTFVQKLGEAVLIPAGCPHQVRNLKSCIKVALDFISPENVHECIRLTGELRSLPRNHQAKEDKLEVWKMIIYAVKQAVNDTDYV